MTKKVQVTTVVDNYIDIFIPSTEVATYPAPGRASQLWAEQGLSLWIEVFEEDQTKRILYDFGRSDQVFLRNAELLGLDFRKLDYLDQLGKINIPTLIIVGEDDPGTPVDASRAMHERILNSKLVVVPSARHLSNIEQPEIFNAALLEFLNKQSK